MIPAAQKAVTTAVFCSLILLVFFFPGGAISLQAALNADVLTFHNDNARTGQNLQEEILTLANVNTNKFGKLRVLPADGKVDAQPLYAAGVVIPGRGPRNVLIVTTEEASVYAYDADSSTLFWRVSLLGPGELPSDNRGCSQVSPEIGVTSTPVIDRQLGTNGAIFVVAMSRNSSFQYVQRLHALDLATGTALLPAAVIAGTYPGIGDTTVNGNLVFDPGHHKERAGLLLLDGVVYTAWSSHCDIRPYTGWIMGYDERTLEQTSVLNITPNGSGGAIWMSGCGLAADPDGNILFLAANGSFDTNLTADGFPSLGNYGNVFLKLSTANRVLSIVDYFGPSNTQFENARDGDLGSGGAIVLPDMLDSLGNPRRLAVGAGKDHNLYLVDRANMGKFNPNNDNAAYQKVTGAFANGVYSTPAFFNGTLYYGAVATTIKAFPFQNAVLMPVSSQTATSFNYPGTTPGISANGTQNAILWATESSTALPSEVLHAYSATNLANELYNSNQAGGRDQFGAGNKYIVPTIASGRVYVGTPTGVGVFGLLDQSTLTPLQTWRDNHFGNPSNVGAGADDAAPAGDGILNLIKYAIGLDPFASTNLSHLLVPSIQPSAGQSFGTLALTRFTRPTDISYIVEVSGDLANWTSGPANVVVLVDNPGQLIVRDATPIGPAPRFMRLRVSAF